MDLELLSIVPETLSETNAVIASGCNAEVGVLGRGWTWGFGNLRVDARKAQTANVNKYAKKA